MSEITIWLRAEALKAENFFASLPAKIEAILAGNPASAAAEVTTIDAAGAVVQTAVVGVINRVFPGSALIDNALLTPLVQALEATAEHILGADTATTVTTTATATATTVAPGQ